MLLKLYSWFCHFPLVVNDNPDVMLLCYIAIYAGDINL